MYSKFVTEWIPQKMTVDGNEPRKEGNIRTLLIDERKDVLNIALLRFNKREDYQELLGDHRRRTLKDTVETDCDNPSATGQGAWTGDDDTRDPDVVERWPTSAQSGCGKIEGQVCRSWELIR